MTQDDDTGSGSPGLGAPNGHDEPSQTSAPGDGSERRAHPRIPAEWPITIALPEGYFEANLRDVSASGVCFHVDRPVAEMTVLRLQLDLDSQGDKHRVDGRGVVVRCKRIAPALEHYEVAVFFDQIEAHDREVLARHCSPN